MTTTLYLTISFALKIELTPPKLFRNQKSEAAHVVLEKDILENLSPSAMKIRGYSGIEKEETKSIELVITKAKIEELQIKPRHWSNISLFRGNKKNSVQ